MKAKASLRTLACALAITSTLLAWQTALAVNINWTGASGTSANWSDSANWSPAVPGAGDNLIFSGGGQLINTNDLTIASSGWVQLNATSGDYSFYGNPLTISGATNVLGANAFYLPLTLGAAQYWDRAVGSSLTVSNTLTLGGTLTLAGDGDTTLGGVVSGTGPIIQNGGGTLTVYGGNTFTGGITVNAGYVSARSPNASGYGAVGNGNLVINSGGTVTANGDNSVMGQAAGIIASRSVTINTGGTLTTGDRSGHLPVVILNGGTLSGTTVRNDYGNWNLDLGVYTLTNGSSSTISGGGNVTLGQTGGTVFNIGAGDLVDVSLTIAHTASATDLGLIKTGDGVLRLSAPNTYTSPTTIQRGTLELSGGNIDTSPTITLASSGVLNVQSTFFSVATNQTLSGTGKVIGTVNDNNAGAAITPGANGTAGTLTIDTLSLSGNATLNFDLANVTTVGGGVNDLLVVTNLALSSSTPNVVNISFLNGVPAAGTYTLIQYQAGPPAGPVTTLAATASRYSYSFSSDGSSIKLTVTGTPASLVWKGDGVTNVWDVVTTPSWLKGATPDVFYQADNVIFNDTGSALPSINIAAAVTPTTVLVDATKDYTLAGSGKITGSASLVKSNTGSLLLLTDNDQLGPTRIEFGTVFAGNGGTSGLPGAGNITNNATLIFNRSDSPTLLGPISGTGKITKFGAGTITTVSSHPFTGSLTISNGAIQLGNNTDGAAGFAGSVSNYATLVVRGTNNPTFPGPIVGTGGIQLFGTNTVRFNSVNLIGTGTLEVGNNNGITANRPTLTIGDGDNLTIGRLMVGQTGSWNGNVTQTGGILNITDVTEGEGPFRLGHWPTETSTYNQSGGMLIITGVPNARISLGVDGTGVWNMSGGTAMVNRIDINERNATGNGSLNLTNGTILVGAGGIVVFAPYTNILAGGTIGALASFSSAASNTLAGAVTFDTGPYTITLAAPCVGPGSITKQGSGILALNGTSYSSGPLTVQAGTLQGGGTFAGPITVQSGAALSAGGTLATGTLTTSNVTFSAGAGLVLDLSSTAATSDLLAAKGALTLEAAIPVTFNFLGGAPFPGTAYTIVTNWVPRSGPGSLSYVNPTRYAVNLDQSQANRIQVTFSGSNAGLVWKGNVNNLWNYNADANWLNGNAPSTYYQADAVVFDVNGLGAPNVSLAAEMNPASVTVNAAGDYTFSGGAINTLGNLVKSGAGKLTLLNNASVATAVINGGTLQVGNGGTSGSVAGNIADYSSLVFNRSDGAVCSSVISGPGTLTQAGTGTLLLLGNSTFYGGATVNPGTTVQVGNGVAFDSGLLGVGPVNNQGTINYFRSGSPTLAATHTGNGALNFIGVNLIGQSSYQLAATNTFTGPVTVSNARFWSPIGALGFGNPSSITILQGGGIFANAVAYSSVANIPITLSGTGWMEGAGFLGALRLQNGMNWAGPITLAGNSRITAYDNALSNVISGTITGPYEVEFGINASGFLSLAPASANSFSALRLSPGTLWINNANALPANVPLVMNGGTLKLNGQNFTVSSVLSPNGGSIQNGSSTTPVTVTVNTDSDSVYTGTFADGGPQTLALVKNGKGVLALTGLSTNQGGVTVNGGVLALRNGGGNGVIRGTVTMQPGTLLLSQNNDSFGYNGGVSQITNLNLNGAALIHTTANNLTLWQNLRINMTGGYMAATNVATLPSTGARLDLGTGANINTLPSAVSSVIGGGNLYLRQADNTFNVAEGAAADDLLVTAPITQAAANYNIIKNGAGRMKVMNILGINGAITVNGGSLVLGSPASTLTNSGAITLATGTTLDIAAAGDWTMGGNQTLQGGGTVVGNITDSSGTVIKPGPSPGTLTVQGNLTLNGAGSLSFDLANTTTVGGGVNDLIQVNGNLSLADSFPTLVNFSFLNGAPTTSGAYTIIKYTGSLTGSAAGLTNSAGGVVATFSVDTVAKAVKVSFTVPGQSLVWQGDGLNNNWDFDTASVNWYNGTVNTNFYQLDTVRFDDSRTTLNTTVYLNGALTPASMTVDSANNYTFTTISGGKLTGVTSITKNNNNTMGLGCANDFTGTITVNGGLLKLESGASPLGGFGNKIIVKPGAALDYAGNTMGNNTGRGYDYTIGGAGPDGSGALVNASATSLAGYANISNLTLTADSVVGGTARFDVGSGQTNTTFNGGGFKLIKTGSNEIDIRTQTVTNLLALVITNGDLYHENFDRTNSWELTTTNYALTGGRLGVYGGRYFNMPVVLDAGGIYNRGGGTPNWICPIRLDSGSVFYNNAAQNFYGPVYGPGAMWVDGGLSVLIVTNANTYAGGTVISNAPTTTSAVDATSGSAALVVTHPSGLGTGPITLNGLSHPSLATNTSFFLTNVLRAVEFGFSSPATVANDIVLPSVTVSNASLHGRDANQVINLTGAISGGFSGFTNWIDFGVAGNGVFRYANNANTFVGTTTVFRGLLAITGDGSLGNSANVLRVNSPAGLRFDAPNISVAHNVYVTLNNSTFSLFGDNNGDGTPDTVNNATISGLLSGSGSMIVRGTNGVLTLTGNNSSYTGGFELQEPVVLQVASSANLGTAYVAIKGGSTFRYTGTGAETMTRVLWNDSAALGGGTVDIPNGSAVLTWNPSGGTCNQNFTKTGAGTLNYGGAISGSAVVRVNGGTLALTGNNSYVGPTFVNAGTLFVNGSLPAANAVVVASGSTLGGTGTINCPVDMQLGSRLQPGANGIGTLTIASPLALSPTTATTMEIDGTAGTGDRVASLSTVTYGGTLTVNNLTGTPAVGTKFTLFSAVDRLGSFVEPVTLPPVSAPLYWTNMLAIDGSIQLLSTVNLTPVDVTWGVSNGKLNLAWPADHIGWRLVVQTNAINVGIVTNAAAWTTWPNSANVNSVSIPIDPANPTVFYKLVYP